MPTPLRVASFFSGCGGMDLGFSLAGFDVVFANDINASVQKTYDRNHARRLDLRSITDVKSSDIPCVSGFIGGPPCQSWSLIGSMRGENDARGRLFYEYIRLLEECRPDFFVAENVPGIVSRTHKESWKKIIHEFHRVGYSVKANLVDAAGYGVPQERKRIVAVGYSGRFSQALGRRDRLPDGVGGLFSFPSPSDRIVTLREAIGDLPDPLPSPAGMCCIPETLAVPNHEYALGGFSPRFLTRNRRRGWDEVSFTIQASSRHCPLHPSSPPMVKTRDGEFYFSRDKDHPGKRWIGDDGKTHPPPADPIAEVRRFSVRECARIQSFPDSFVFEYKKIDDGYKMVGNAVPVKLAQAVAEKIRADIESCKLEAP